MRGTLQVRLVALTGGRYSSLLPSGTAWRRSQKSHKSEHAARPSVAGVLGFFTECVCHTENHTLWTMLQSKVRL